MPDAARLASAVADVERHLNASTWHDVGGSFTCAEAEALAELLTAAGATEAAEHLRTGHAAQDELGDLHFGGGR